MRVLFTDFKYSYANELHVGIFTEYFQERGHEVALLGAVESRLDHCVRLTTSASMKDMLLDCVNPRILQKTFRLIRKFCPDIVYLTSVHPINEAVAAYVRSRLKDTLLVSHIHDPQPHNKFYIARSRIAMQKLQMKLSHLLVCYGSAIRAYLEQQDGIDARRIVVVPNSGPARYMKQLPEDREVSSPAYISLIGRFEDYKGIGVFLEAASRLNGNLGAKVLLAGSGRLDPYEALISQIRNIRVENRFISDEEMFRYIRQSHVLVLPYIGGILQSGLIAAAYSQACPVIVSDAGCLPELVVNGKTGFVVLKNDSKKLAEAMQQVVQTETKELMGQACLDYYEKHLRFDITLAALEQRFCTDLDSFRKGALRN